MKYMLLGIDVKNADVNTYWNFLNFVQHVGMKYFGKMTQQTLEEIMKCRKCNKEYSLGFKDLGYEAESLGYSIAE